MLNTVDGPSEGVEDYLCDPEEMPLGARESRLPCPEDCVLNDWGPWSRCSLVRAQPTSESAGSAAQNGTGGGNPLRFISISFFFLLLPIFPRGGEFQGFAVIVIHLEVYPPSARRKKERK